MLADWPDRSIVNASTRHSNGPVTSDDIGDGHGTSHSSTVWYYKDTEPHFVAQAYKVRYGGRHPTAPCSFHEWWRMESRVYYEWDVDDDRWVEVRSVSPTDWRSTGTPGLAWHDAYVNVFMDHGAYVKQRLRYHISVCSFDVPESTDWLGRWHYHFLE